MTITDQRTKDAADNLRAYVDGADTELQQEMERDLDELIAAVIDWTERRLKRHTTDPDVPDPGPNTED